MVLFTYLLQIFQQGLLDTFFIEEIVASIDNLVDDLQIHAALWLRGQHRLVLDHRIPATDNMSVGHGIGFATAVLSLEPDVLE